MLKLQLKTKDLLLFFLLIFFYFFSRLYQLVKIPVFVDEAIYVRWSQVMRSEQTLRFLPLSDGKQPLFMWATIPFLKIFSDPLSAGRFVSVIAGLIGLVGLGVLSFLLFKKTKLALAAMFFYLIAPFTFFFDRMALVDSLLSAFGIWSFVFAVLLGKFKRLDLAMILGIVLGGAMLTKSPAIFFIVLSLLTVLVLNYRYKILNIKSFVLMAVVLFFAFAIYNILRLGPNFQMIALRNKDYVWPIEEILKHPSDPLKPHLQDIVRYYWYYLTPPVFLLGLVGLVYGLQVASYEFLLILFWFTVPLFAQSALAKVFTARYILYSVPLFLLFVSLAVSKLAKKFPKFMVLGSIFFIPSLYFIYQLWYQPEKASLPVDERRGYLEDWTAGQGIKEISEFIKARSREENIIIGTEGYFGTLPDGLQIYLEGIKRVTTIGVGYPIGVIPEQLVDAKSTGDTVFLVVNRSRFEAKDNRLMLVKEYPKPGGDSLLFFEVK